MHTYNTIYLADKDTITAENRAKEPGIVINLKSVLGYTDIVLNPQQLINLKAALKGL